jgi:hypothetical protein
VVHYCYGDERWSKRQFWTEQGVPQVWEARARAKRGSVLAEVLGQLREARRFYARTGMDAKGARAAPAELLGR